MQTTHRISQSLPPHLTLSTCSSKFPLPTSHPLTNPTGGRSEIHPQSNHFSPLSLLPSLGPATLPSSGVACLAHRSPCSTCSLQFLCPQTRGNPFEILTSCTPSPHNPEGPSQITQHGTQSPNRGQALQHLASHAHAQPQDLTTQHPLPQGSAHPIPSTGDDPPQYNKACFLLFQRASIPPWLHHSIPFPCLYFVRGVSTT